MNRIDEIADPLLENDAGYSVAEAEPDELGYARFNGLRMSADEFLQIPDEGFRYELVDGVVILSPSPTPPHQRVAMEIAAQIKWHLRSHRVGEVFADIDVHLGQSVPGKDLVYAPDVVFVKAERLPGMNEKIFGAPELVVEVVSRGSRRRDLSTKRADYERFGVLEYWIVDPYRQCVTFLRLIDGRFVEVAPESDVFASRAVPDFRLDLNAIREAFKPW